ncbi:sugar-binding domain-containing protein [Aegicerativicinus sediminis]|uniref:sugar-binding domain-containing protein n=1 Tax=Aegicerativicinus sediminis TaxID=2893202 RepID=UPI001E3CAE10|nr:sugar-binding domain-containing protein [Aegicerativicinus sediminis]
MKKILIILSLLVYINSFGQISFGNPEKINDDWKFILQDNPDYKSLVLDVSDWETVDVPYDWSIKGQLDSTLASCTGYLPGGIGWFRKTIEIPLDKSKEKVYLYFEGVYNRSEVFVNGESIGARPNGYMSFAFDATPYVKFGEENTIAVRVDHSQSADSRWYPGSGIYRNVWLVYSNPVHIKQWGVFAYPEITENQGILNLEVSIDNETDTSAEVEIVNRLVNSQGKIVASGSNNIEVLPNESNKIQTSLAVSDPQLWDLTHPNLYQLETVVLREGKEIDRNTTQTGFRTFTFDPNKGFALNGEFMKMKGVCLHHDLGVLGSAFYPEVWRSRLQTLKEIGVNAIRTSHNPQAPEFYGLCDEIGLLVLNEAYDEWEFPKRKWLKGWNVGKPGYEGSYDIFADWSEKDLEDLVRRDRNHLSVFAWSIGNEVDYPNDPYSHPVLDGGGDTGFTQAVYGGFKKDAPKAERLGGISKRLVSAVKKHDNSRPTTAGLAGVTMSNATDYPGALDITGYNYTENRYTQDHEKYPNRVIFGSETRHDYDAWLAVKNNDYIFGQFLWTGMDYLGESREWPSRGFYSGLIDFMGRIKPMGYLRQSLWAKEPMIYIGTHKASEKSGNEYYSDDWSNWNYNKDELIKVVCYTNTAKAKLVLNGKEVGQVQNYNEETGYMSWNVPFQPGKLEAIGLDENNKEQSRCVINTSDQPHALELKQVGQEITKGGEVAQIKIQVVDKNGILVDKAKNEIKCTITGPGELLGMEAGNNSDMGDYTDNVQQVYHGELVTYIKAKKDSGAIKIRFTSPGLQPVEKIVNLN